MASMYNPGVPTGTIDLDEDYLNLQNNFSQLDITFGTDHLPFSDQSAQNGYHKSVHLNPISTVATDPPNNYPVAPPTVTTDIGQLFSSQVNDGISTDEALFFLTGGGGGKLMQLTRNVQPIALANGVSFIAGGILVQWGIVTFPPTSNASEPFNIPFPVSCFGLWVQGFETAGFSSNQGTFIVKIPAGPNVSTFAWDVNGSTTFKGFYWIAIGI